jgi:predicted MFS family arabinose efflux permease
MQGQRTLRERALLPVLIFCGLIIAVNGTLGAPLIPTVARDMHVSLGSAQWMLTVTLLVGAVSTPLLGRLGDGPHRRRVMVAAMSVVLVGAAVSATAQSFPQLVVGRALMGLTYGILPMCIAAAREHLPAAKVPGAVAALSVTGATGVGLGFPLTGLIAQYLDYHFAFWFAVVFIAPAIAAVLLVLPRESGVAMAHRRIDLIGAAMVAGALAALLLGVSDGESWGWESARIVGLFAASIVLFAVWAWHELRTDAPLIDLRLLSHRAVLTANVAALLLGGAMYVGFSVINRLAQAPESTGYGFGASLLVTGLVLAPLAVGSQLSSRLAHIAARRLGMLAVLPIGGLLIALTNFGLAAEHSHLWELAAGMLLLGAGIGSTFAAMPTLIISGVPPEETGSATSFNQVLRSVGGSVGSALSGGILAAYTVTGQSFPTEDGYTLSFLVSGAACLAVAAGIALVARRLHLRAQAPGGTRPAAEGAA